MPKVIAIAGKGGVGKTTFGGLLVRYLLEKRPGRTVLAVDADPNSNLNELLGVKVTTTIGDAREIMKKEVPPGMTKDTWFEYKVHEAIIEGKGFDLLVMGRPEGAGCYCAANSLAKKYIDMLKENYSYLVVDNEAGMEHISRLVTQDIDQLFVISDPSPRGVVTARRIIDLIGELGLNIAKTEVVINRVPEGDEERLREKAREHGLDGVGMIREDKEVITADAEGVSVFSLSRSARALIDGYGIFDAALGTEGREQGNRQSTD
jgi:CO dehydrogenase maturation factor